ncbi:MAG: tRNA glutamyl-Q(34) synthetase GluQRS [Spartobacteria bacterium]|nr:tRNA glutamyl-Q(34) synthetase GluQRS [Spartobacteria bacterium]
MTSEYREAPPRIRGRLAPSPTGALHLGNARTFLITWLSIHNQQGQLLLRMEDLDHPKVKPHAAEQVMEDLAWLGLDWDEGPDIGGPFAPYVQSQRRAEYRRALEQLKARDLVYPCVCSRKDVEEALSAPHETTDGLYYPGTCEGRFASYEAACEVLPKGRLPAWRFRVPATKVVFDDLVHGRQAQQVHTAVGDFVVARDADGAGYMLAVVVDDAAMQVTEVLRGDDLLAATHRQVLLHRALDVPLPTYIHVPLVVSEEGRRLAKRHGDTRIASLRNRGIPAARVVGLLAWWCGWAAWGEQLMPADLLPRFDLQSLPRKPSILTQKVRDYLGIREED